MLRGVPIRYSAPALIALPVLVIGVVMSLLWRSSANDAVERVADQGIGEIHTLVGSRVRSLLSIPPRVCQLNEHLIETGALDPDDLESWYGTFLNQYHQFDMLSAIGWGSTDGRAAWVSRYADGNAYWALENDPSDPTMLEWQIDEDGRIPNDPTNTFDFDLTTRPWYATPLNAGHPAWSEPYLWIGGADVTLGISFGIPIRDEKGTIVGVIDADYSLNDLSKFLSSIEIGPGGFLALIDNNGQLIAGSTRIDVFDDNNVRRHLSDPTHPVLTAAAGSLVGIGAQRGRLDPISIDGETYLFRASDVGSDLGIDWILVTAAAQSDYTGSIERGFQVSFLLSIGAVLVVGLVGIASARWLVTPLRELVLAVERIGEGDLDFETNIDHAPEYNRLGNAMNAMIVALRDRMRMRKSLQLASEVQKNLLPSDEPHVKGLDIVGHSTYCDETGGDYYDFLDISGGDRNEAVIALGDVMGHGVAAAMLMATARGILRSRCAQSGSLAEFLEHLNGLLLPDTQGTRFMTMLLATVNATSGTLRWASAGHGAPIIYDCNKEAFLELEGGGLPLGIAEGAEYEEYTIDVATPGHIILLATDGIWEAKGEGDELFGMDRLFDLIRSLAHRPAKDISDGIQSAVANFQGAHAPDDDMTYVVIRVP